ncbi:uncharacterized protein LOC144906877 [Branchiostoma floridae x Branchiostoma belcheri]
MLHAGKDRISTVRRRCALDKTKPRPQLPRANGHKYSGMEHSFENLVLEGGGAKGVAYIGAAKILDEAGILPNIKRFAGTSAGAITATWLAIGMKAEDILEEVSLKNLMDLLDAPVSKGWLGYLKWIPHIPGVPSWLTVDSISMALTIATEKGACEGEEFLDWFGDVLERHLARLHPSKKGLDKDITFDKLYHALGVELCIVAYNMVLGNENYFHVKTTPMMKIKEAVRMSMSIPVVFKPCELSSFPSTFVDGAMAANYPIWAFDGWYLSMKKEDTFHKRLKMDEGQMVRRMFHPEHRRERFGTRNDKTLGLLLFSSDDREMYQERYDERHRKLAEMKSDHEFFKETEEVTELHKSYKEKMAEREKAQNLSKKTLEQLFGEDIKEMIERVEGVNPPPIPEMDTSARGGFSPIPRLERPTIISTEKAKELFFKIFSDEDIAILDAPSKEKAFELMMLDENGKLTTDRLWKIYDNVGPLQQARRTYLGHRLVSTPRQYFSSMIEFVGRHSGTSEEDVHRSVAIDTGYVGTMDFDMANEDMEFLMRQAAWATIAFLEEKKGAMV